MHPPLAIPLRAGALALAVFLLSLAAPRASAAVPAAANDLCGNAQVIPGAGPFPYLSPLVDVLNTTTNGDPVLPRDCATNMTRSVWFTFAPAASGFYSVSMGPDTGTDFGDGNNGNDSVLAIYTSASDCAGPLTLFHCNDDAKGFNIPLAAGLSTNLNSGTTYYILAWVGAISASGLSNNPAKLQLRVTRPAVPANDLCSGAEIISSAGASPYFSSIIDNTLATTNDDRAISCGTGQRSVWFKFTPAATGTHIISARDGATTVGTGIIALFQSSGGDCTLLTQLSCSLFTNSTTGGFISRLLTANITYYIMFADDELEANVGETSVQIKITRGAPPIVTTLSAASITSTGATFRGTVNPNGGTSTKTRYWFEWGTSTNFTSASPGRLVYVSQLVTTTNFAVSLTTNLPAGLTYYFRAVATNEYGTNYGAAQVIIQAASPTLTPPVLLGEGSARLDFTGQPGRVYFVQASTDLPGNWTDLGTAAETAAGLYQFQTPTNASPYRFFKLRLP